MASEVNVKVRVNSLKPPIPLLPVTMDVSNAHGNWPTMHCHPMVYPENVKIPFLIRHINQ